MFRTFKILATVIAFASLAVLNVSGQDLLANQAPVDRKMRAIDSVSFQRMLENSGWILPETNSNKDKNNKLANTSTTLPDSFLINLRGFCMPTTNREVTSDFGIRWGRQHKGLDIRVYIGDTIRSAFNGRVRIVREDPKGLGNYVVISHPNGLETIYAHMSKNLVNENQMIRAGHPIGLGGNSGRSNGSHLHFETRLCGVALNPALMFDFKNQDVVDDEWMFRRSTYNQESALATRMRGTGRDNNSTDGLDNQQANADKVQNVNGGNQRYHKVKKGETLAVIARKHSTTVAALCNMNNIKKTTTLRPGQILKYNQPE